MTEERKDKLGRKIPSFDRSAAAKKAYATKEKNDPGQHKRMVTAGGRKRTRGYFGKLKAEGKTEEIAQLGRIGGSKSRRTKAKPTQPNEESVGRRSGEAEDKS